MWITANKFIGNTLLNHVLYIHIDSGAPNVGSSETKRSFWFFMYLDDLLCVVQSEYSVVEVQEYIHDFSDTHSARYILCNLCLMIPLVTLFFLLTMPF